MKSLTIKGAQKIVDQWIKNIGGGYFSELTILAQIVEEIGEVSRVISRRYGEQSFKESDKKVKLSEELSDLLFALICLANKTDIDLESAFKKNLKKKSKRDKIRHQKNQKIKTKKK